MEGKESVAFWFSCNLEVNLVLHIFHNRRVFGTNCRVYLHFRFKNASEVFPSYTVTLRYVTLRYEEAHFY